jgi:uncharacterized protein (DUF1800 family)
MEAFYAIAPFPGDCPLPFLACTIYVSDQGEYVMAGTRQAFIAATRFGLGAKQGDFDAISGNPEEWLTAQLDPKYIPWAAVEGPPEDEAGEKSGEPCVMACASPAAGDDQPDEARTEKLKEILAQSNREYTKLAAARTRGILASAAPFFERLARFWANHFTVSVTRRQDMGVLSSFERDAIRPHVLGNFRDMLQASTHHPAMTSYLDNLLSTGPKSPMGGAAGMGLNENLAREILELHTLGVNGGYTQKDVTEFAKILTGWTVRTPDTGEGQEFLFAAGQHEPGSKTLLGEIYAEGGVREAESALDRLTQHPSTAKFIAAKLARHFIADDPPSSAVQKLEAAYRDGKGELLPLYRALIALEESWQEPLPKLKTPEDVVFSVLRATDIIGTVGDSKVVDIFRRAGQMPWSAPSPAGWSDRAADWMGAEALLQRIEFAKFAAETVHARLDPVQLMEDTVGPVVSATTREAVTRAGSAQEGITLLFASPEFQRR